MFGSGGKKKLRTALTHITTTMPSMSPLVRRIDSLLSLRYLGFILDTEQGSRYKEWEDAQKRKQEFIIHK
jgi:hypothetical protein